MEVRSVGDHEAQSVAWWRALLAEPAVVFLLLAEIALVKRDYLPDVLLVAGVLVLIAVHSRRWGFRQADASPVPSHRLPTGLWVVVPVLALGISVLPRTSVFTDLAFVAVALAGLMLVLLPGPSVRPAEPRPAQVPPGWWLWWVPALIFCTVEVFSLTFQPEPRVDSPAHPSLSGVLEPALAHWPARSLALALWFAAGVWLYRRVRAWAA